MCIKLFALLFLTVPAFLQAQSDEVDTYQLLLSEVSITQNYNSSAGQDLALIDSAKQYARAQDYVIAIVFLEEYMQKHTARKTNNKAMPQIIDSRPYSISVSAGVDFNRQEFEIGYIQTDSVIANEISKPFMALDIGYTLWERQNTRFRIQSGLRYDKENTSGSVQLASHFGQDDKQYTFSAGFRHDENNEYSDFTYSEVNMQQSVYMKIYPALTFRFNNELRYKNYANPSQSIPDFINDEARLEFSHYRDSGAVFGLTYRADINESLEYINNDYFDQNLELSSSKIFSTGTDLHSVVGYQNKLFHYALQDSAINNRSQAYHGDLRLKYPFSGSLAWKADYRGQYKIFSRKSEQDPDYFMFTFSNRIRYTFLKSFSFEFGHTYEHKKHHTFEEALTSFIDEQNYHGNGAVLGFEYHQYSGALLSIEGTYIWRRYPQSVDESWGSIYHNRNILNFNFLLQLPLNNALSMNVFAFYDNDQDLDSDSGNTRSSMFSAELEYRF